MTLAAEMGLRKGDVLSVVGAGGKTTLIFMLARELAGHKTLIATTTRMYFPEEESYDYLFIDEQPKPTHAGVYFLSGTPREGKAMPCQMLRSVLGDFDYTLIEADGAKGKLLKGWSGHEPVIIPETTKTLGVLNLGLIGSATTQESIHRLEEYMKLTGARLGDRVTAEHLRTVAAEGLFRGAVGERILCIAGAQGRDYKFEGADKCIIL